MAEFGNSPNTTSSRFSFFNRSMTTLRKEKPSQKPPQLDRSLTKLGESPRGGGSVVKRLCSFFESAKPSSSEHQHRHHKLKPSKSIEASESSIDSPTKLVDSSPAIRLPGTEDRIVLYFTSLRGIRRTFEDCYAVRMIFRGFRVWVDERDISMDANYRKELMNVLGENGNGKRKGHVALPQVFIRGRHVGGADIIKYMYEVGELGKVLEGLPRTKGGFVCESCGDVRFAPCGNCSGSRKVFDEDEGVLKRCLECNENGLIRCPNCCSS
ncbi:uncharacterized protein At3g28850-like [Vigna umbellata]|uniref:uncharacterized protein At3g28850-like n=1 Tax=Vigna umbellata TaxID=87088 RepID=UPI001F5E43F0|nr:uncharacterized protein At3g28850-like [Vigna umbellata]XP_047164251.1 uncharacterized protein At3g28850-like [Vigna umbellata]XP_047164252.1 uncharacterized protein At3g28850-like [Vigna umbellata]XP_047164253.1 uncharacterized protein At3g28850-like [Vigna umbellata]